MYRSIRNILLIFDKLLTNFHLNSIASSLEKDFSSIARVRESKRQTMEDEGRTFITAARSLRQYVRDKKARKLSVSKILFSENEKRTTLNFNPITCRTSVLHFLQSLQFLQSLPLPLSLSHRVFYAQSLSLSIKISRSKSLSLS